MRITQEEAEQYLKLDEIKIDNRGKKVDIKNKEFFRLVAIKPIERKKYGNDKSGRIIWLCKCICGNYVKVPYGRLTGGYSKSCGCYNLELISKRAKDYNFHLTSSKKLWKGTKDISGSYFTSIKRGAIRRNIPFTITVEYLQELLEKQQYKCFFTNLPINCSRSHNKECSTYEEQIASVDRIDSSKGYIPGNIQWVHKDINWMKQDFSQEKFLEYCRLVVQNF